MDKTEVGRICDFSAGLSLLATPLLEIKVSDICTIVLGGTTFVPGFSDEEQRRLGKRRCSPLRLLSLSYRYLERTSRYGSRFPSFTYLGNFGDAATP